MSVDAYLTFHLLANHAHAPVAYESHDAEDVIEMAMGHEDVANLCGGDMCVLEPSGDGVAASCVHKEVIPLTREQDRCCNAL